MGQELAPHAPRRNQLQHWHPTELPVIITTTAKIINLFIIHISNRSVPFPARIIHQVNSTPHSVMCKFNRVIFFNAILPFCPLDVEFGLRLKRRM